MEIKPILFNTEMVRAILDGRKTCTRRIAKGVLNRTYRIELEASADGKLQCVCYYGGYIDELKAYADFSESIRAPYQLGDILYVRETWAWCPCWNCGVDGDWKECCHKSDRKYSDKKTECGCYVYRASCKENEYPSADGWHPSIHMPKEAARTWLKVTDVRVERLQDITEDGAKAEGANWKNGQNVGWEEKMKRTAKERFSEIWDSTIKKSDLDRYGWDANPWVWVIEFERCEKPKEVEQ